MLLLFHINLFSFFQVNSSAFPVPEFTVSFGFLFVLIVEQIVKEFRDFSTDTEESENRDESRNHPSFRSFMLLLALSLHSVFEGLAIGLQPDMNNIIQIFIAVTLHKVIIAFSLGLNLIQTNLSLSSIVKSNVIFSIASPIGMAAGILVDEFGKSDVSNIVSGVLQGLACGTFVYVTFFEILPHELNSNESRLCKLVTLILGFSMVCLVLFLDPTEAPECIQKQYHLI